MFIFIVIYMQITSHVCCPSCKGKIYKKGNSNNCDKCKLQWPIKDDIYCFNLENFYWNHISENKMEKLIESSIINGWESGLEKILLPLTDRYVFEYAINENRADWHYMLPVKENSLVLDLGCGWGGVTIPLARFYNVIAADSTFETLKFIKVRAEQEGLSKKIQFVRTDPLDYGRLPFSDSTFDLVVLNGVLEWVGTSRLDLSPDECQYIALKEVIRILKPGGCIYIGIENRYSYTGFIGAREHDNIPFADLMPRKLANFFSRISGKKHGFRTYTHSHSQYKSLLSKAGFSNIKFYFPIPSYREPLFIFSEDDRRSMKFFIKNKFIRSLLKRTLFSFAFRFNIEKNIIYSFGIFAKRKNGV